MSGVSVGAQAAAVPMSAARRWACIVLLVVLGFALGCSEFVVIGIEPELAEYFGVNLAEVGKLISFFAMTYAVATPVLALSTGRFRRYQLLIAYSVLFCLGNAVAAFAPSFGVLLLSRVLIGAVSGALLAVGVTYLPELVGPKRVSIAISVVYAAFSVAMVISTSLAKMVADALSWEVALVATLVMAVVTCALLIAVLPREGATDAPATAREQARLLREPAVLAGMAIFVFGVGSVYVFYGYITPYLEQVLGMDTAAASGVLMGYGVMTLISNLVAGGLDARFGLKTLLVSFPVQAALLALLSVVGAAMPAALVVIMAIGLSMYLLSVPVISMFMGIAGKRHPKALTLASSLEPMAFNIGIAFGTAVGGVVVTGPGMGMVGFVGAVFSLVACALAALTLRLSRREA